MTKKSAAFPGTSFFTGRWVWIAAAVCMVAELLLFVRMTKSHHADIYPRWNDQIQYLSEAYGAYEIAESAGFAAGIKATLTKSAAQGMLHDFCALFVFKLSGGTSRTAALSLNLLVLLAWQATLLTVITRVTRSRALGWIAFSLVPCLAWPWSAEAGSAVDFRLDHAAMCLMGITATVALMTDGFRSRRWSVVFGAVVGLTLITRFLTGAYFALIFPACAIWILCSAQRWTRLRHLIYSGLVTAVIAGPAFWFNRESIYAYYWVGHISGAESTARVPGLDFLQSTQFVFGNLAQMQLGTHFLTLAGGVTVCCTLLLLVRYRQRGTFYRDWLFLAMTFLFLPAIVLIFHRQKSPFVLGVITPGVVLLVVWLWATLWSRLNLSVAARWSRAVPTGLVAGSIIFSGHYFVSRQLWNPHSDRFIQDTRSVNRLADTIFENSRRAGIANPAIGVDQIVDFVDARILQVICYERQGVWVNFQVQLPPSILAEEDATTMHRLTLCDFVLLTETMHGDGHWPYDQQMRRLFPQLKSYCEETLRPVALVEIFGREMSLYQRREIP